MATKTKNDSQPKGEPSTDSIEKRTIPVTELRMVDKDYVDGKEVRSRTVEGYAAIYGEWADMGWMKEQIVPGAFKSVLQTSDTRALFNHNRDHVLARQKSGTLELWEDEKGLGFRFDIPESRDDILESVERKDVDECSFAFRTKVQRWVWTDDGQPDERYLEEFSELPDISLVTYPQYDNTTVALRSKEEYRAKEEAEQTEETNSGLELMKMKMSLHRHSI